MSSSTRGPWWWLMSLHIGQRKDLEVQLSWAKNQLIYHLKSQQGQQPHGPNEIATYFCKWKDITSSMYNIEYLVREWIKYLNRAVFFCSTKLSVVL